MVLADKTRAHPAPAWPWQGQALPARSRSCSAKKLPGSKPRSASHPGSTVPRVRAGRALTSAFRSLEMQIKVSFLHFLSIWSKLVVSSAKTPWKLKPTQAHKSVPRLGWVRCFLQNSSPQACGREGEWPLLEDWGICVQCDHFAVFQCVPFAGQTQRSWREDPGPVSSPLAALQMQVTSGIEP